MGRLEAIAAPGMICASHLDGHAQIRLGRLLAAEPIFSTRLPNPGIGARAEIVPSR